MTVTSKKLYGQFRLMEMAGRKLGISHNDSTADVLVDSDGNFGVGEDLNFGSGAGVIGITNAATAPTGSMSSAIVVYAKDVSSAATLGLHVETSVAASTDETKFSHKLPVTINGGTYYMMLTDS